jgi:methionine-S-sulfoxide reductase
VFEIIEGVEDVISGYAGGTKETAKYDIVSTGRTGHAEAVLITHDPKRMSYGQLLKIFFSVAHDPTTLNRQGPDVGPQYRTSHSTANCRARRRTGARSRWCGRRARSRRPRASSTQRLWSLTGNAPMAGTMLASM